MNTQAIVFPEPCRSEVGNVEIPRPGDGDVLLEVEYSALSPGTERWCLTGGLVIPGENPLAFPHVPGYQAAGIVREVGAAVRSVAPGDRVFSRNCAAPSGWGGSWWGGHVGFHVTPEAAVIQLPDSVTTANGASLLLAQVGYNGASKPPVKPGDAAVVIGEGLVGLYAAQVLRHRGARVIVAGLQRFRLNLARRFAADETFDCSSGDLTTHLRDRFPKGVDVVVETASSAATVRIAAGLLKYGGHLVLNGFYPPPANLIDWHWLRGKEITVHCPNSRNRERLEATLELMASGVLHIGELVTHEVPLAEASRAYGLLLDAKADFLGINIRWLCSHSVASGKTN
jgi:2-desacetyl-2-hydroxyethyl bacteriochlorophyllide A dehydrogenase